MTTSVSVVHKLNVLQQTNTNNNNERREIIILRKAPHIQPKDILLTNARKKQSNQQSKTKDTRTTPQPVAVARRNARERNRVKQVNNGFANLRQHIPNFIAAAFESNTRGGSKKLSKVETLRMAVEYIRSLEDLLALDEEGGSSTTHHHHTAIFSSPGSSGTQAYQGDEDDMSTNPTPPPYTYQIIPYDDSENLEPINVEEHILSDPSLMSADLEFRGAQDLSLLNTMSVSDSLSPGMYSEESLSPDDRSDFGTIVVKTENMSHDIPVISLKSEHELPNEHKHGVMDVMHWWETQQSPHT